MGSTEIDRSSRRIAAWDHALREDGRVVIGQDTQEIGGVLVWMFVVLCLGLAYGFFNLVRDGAEGVGSTLLIAAAFLLVVYVSFAVLMIRFRGKTITVAIEGVWLENGELVPWDAMRDASVIQMHKRMVVLSVRPGFQKQRLAQRPWYSRVSIYSTMWVIGSCKIPLSYTLRVDDMEFADWLNSCIENPPARSYPGGRPVWYEKDLERLRAAVS